MYCIETDEYQEGGDPSCSGTPITNTTFVILLKGSRDAQDDLVHIIRSTNSRWCCTMPGVFLVDGRLSHEEWVTLLMASRSVWNTAGGNLLVLEGRFSEWSGLLYPDQWKWMNQHLVAGNNE